jgi:hypothetical protein
MVTKLCKERTLNPPLLPNHSLPNLIFLTIKLIVIEFLTTLTKMLFSKWLHSKKTKCNSKGIEDQHHNYLLNMVSPKWNSKNALL